MPGGAAARPTMSPRVASRRASTGGSPEALPLEFPEPPSGPPTGAMPGLAGLPGPTRQARPGRPSGEVPDLNERLEGLASRGRLSLAPPPQRRGPASPPDDDYDLTELDNPVVYDDPYDGDYDNEDFDDGFEAGDDLDRSTQRGCGRLAVALLVAAAVFCVAVVGVGIWARGKISPGGPAGEQVVVEVVQGQSTSDIGQILEDNGVITDATVWTWYVRFRGGGQIQAGRYTLTENMSMGAALEALQDGPTATEQRVTIPEGLTINQMIARLTDPENGVTGFDAERLRLAMTTDGLRSRFLPPDAPSLEGTLFPETYTLGEDDDELALVERMVTQMDTTLDQLQLEAGAAALGRTPYEILVVASMIEEEARVAEERPMIARVIFNRLAAGTPLGIDATSCYESGQCPPTAAELESESPYNTRRQAGLPPTPISSPSRASIEAALNPTPGDWTGYVLRDTEGHHTFTVTAQEFEDAKQFCRDQGLGCG